MGEYTLDSIVALPVSPRSYGKPSEKLKPSTFVMTIFGTFIQSFIPLEVEKEDQAIRDQIYREEEDVEEVLVTTPISPKRYGKRYKFLQNMSYHGQGSLTGDKKALFEPLSHTEGCQNRDTTRLGFRLEDELPRFNKRAPMFSELEDDDPPFSTTILQEEDFMPPTSLLWGEEPMVTHNYVEAYTSKTHESNDSDHEDPNRRRIRENIARLQAQDESIDSSEYEWDSLSIASYELVVDVIHAYATQPNVVDDSSLGSNEFGQQP